MLGNAWIANGTSIENLRYSPVLMKLSDVQASDFGFCVELEGLLLLDVPH